MAKKCYIVGSKMAVTKICGRSFCSEKGRLVQAPAEAFRKTASELPPRKGMFLASPARDFFADGAVEADRILCVFRGLQAKSCGKSPPSCFGERFFRKSRLKGRRNTLCISRPLDEELRKKIRQPTELPP